MFNDKKTMAIEIQVQDKLGNWLPFGTCNNEAPYIRNSMEQASKFYGGARARAVEMHTGRLIDIL